MKDEMCSFGDCILDPATGTLWRNGAAVRPLVGQPLTLLLLLLKHSGSVVSYARIRREVKGKIKPLEDESIRKLISRLRDLIGDDFTAPRYIKTVPGSGVTFLIKVTPCRSPEGAVLSQFVASEVGSRRKIHRDPEANDEESVSAQPVATESGLPAPQVVKELPIAFPSVSHLEAAVGGSLPKSRGPLPALRNAPLAVWRSLAVTFILIVSLAFWYHNRESDLRSTAQTISIIVLPIKNITGSVENEYVADSMTNAIISAMEVVGGSHVRVTAFNTAMTYKRKTQRVSEIGSELKVEYVLEGSMLRQGKGLRVNMDLRRTHDEGRVTSGAVDVDPENIAAAATLFVNTVLTALPVDLPPFNIVTAYISPSREARDAYVRGEHFLWLRTHEGLINALLEFKSATEADRSYAQAFSQLAITYFMLGGRGWMDQQETAEMGKRALERALALNTKDDDAHAAKGYYCWFYKWDWAEGERELRQAIELNPSNVNALHWYALALTSEGRIKEGREWMRRAIELDPKSAILQTNVGWIEYFGRNSKLAADRMEAVLRDDPSFLSARVKLLTVYSLLGRDEEAFRQLHFIALDAMSDEEQSSLDDAYKMYGYEQVSRSWARDLKKSSPYGYSLVDAETAALSGDRESAVETLLHWQNTHDGWMVFAGVDPAFDSLRKDKRLAALFRTLQQSRTRH